jgi:putative transcriptional regulator
LRVADDTAASEFSISLRGQLLLASPSLADGTFDHSVIILSEHSATAGAAGAIINHRTETTVGELLPEPEFKALRKLPIHHGGPLSTDELTFSSFSWSPTQGLRYRPQISAKAAAKIVGMPGQIVRATIGHSAWSPGQLENELTRGTWITLKPKQSVLSMPHDLSLWNLLLKDISPYHDLLSQAPQNPLLN